jgi:integral membrane protein
MNNKKLLSYFGWVAILEGLSFLILIAASLMKRGFFGDAETGAILVKNVGMAHGVLFVLYVILLFQCKSNYGWGMKKVIVYFILSFIPFGTFWVDMQLKKEKATLKPAVN